MTLPTSQLIKKTCTKCNIEKNLDDYYSNIINKDGKNSWCKSCENKQSHKRHLERYQNDPKYRNKFDEYRLKQKYNLTLKEYNQMFKNQNGLCAICNQPEPSKRNGKIKRLAVDHNHITGKIRGLLCYHCNTSLGFYEKYYKEVQEYLKKDTK